VPLDQSPPWVAPDPSVGRRFARLLRRDTAPELALRRELHRRGRRFRVGVPVPGMARRTIDIAFSRARVAVFVDGCFWHGCSKHSVPPKSNKGWWQNKLAANQSRDVDTTQHLEAAGWRVVRVWEHTPAPEGADLVELALES